MVLLKIKQEFLVDAVIGGHVRSAVSFFFAFSPSMMKVGNINVN